MALDVLIAILERGDSEDDEKREDNEAGGDAGEKIGKNWRMAMARKKMLAIRRNCSSRLRGRKVMMVYLEVMT